MPNINFNCPHCDALLDLSPFEIGAQVKCRNCNRVFLVPSLKSENTPPALTVDNSAAGTNSTKTISARFVNRKNRNTTNLYLKIACVVVGSVELLMLCALLSVSIKNSNKYEAAEKTYLGACRIYNVEIRLSTVALLGSPSDQYLSARDRLDAQGKAMDKSKKILSDAKAKYEKAYSTFSKICADLGKPPPVKMMTP